MTWHIFAFDEIIIIIRLSFHLIIFEPMISDSCKRLFTTVICAFWLTIWVAQAQSVEAIDPSSSKPPTASQTNTWSTKDTQPVPPQTRPPTDSNAPYPWCVQQLYRISGYYSPKPNQQVTTRDTYEQEIRLNGRGTNGASGMPVFNGMVAAPKSYAFGTIIVLPGLGIGQVQDRWWAIVASDWYDRIDVWLGEWDEGIHRAKSVGLRWVIGWYCPGSVTKNVGFDYAKIPQYTNFVDVAFWSIDQNIGRSGPLVTKLQSYLRSLGYLTNDTLPWIYDQQMRELVCRFQIDQLGLSGNEDYCGVLGPQTRSMLKKMLVKKWIFSDVGLYALSNSATISSLFTQPNVRPAWNYQVEPILVTQPKPTISQNIINLQTIKTSFTKVIELWEESDSVVVLQKILAREWLFDRKVTWYFWPITQAALAQFQLKYKLIDSLKHPAAGRTGPATRALLTKKQNLLRFQSSTK